MDVEFLSLVSIAMRVFLIGGVQMVLWCFQTSMLLKQKHPLNTLIIWMVLRMLIITSFANIVLRYYYQNQPWWDIFHMFMMLTVLGGNFIALYYTFEGPFTKIIAATYISDIILYVVMFISIGIVNILEGQSFGLLEVEFQSLDLLIPVIEIMLYSLIGHYFKHILNRFRSYRMRFSKFIWVFLFFGVLSYRLEVVDATYFYLIAVSFSMIILIFLLLLLLRYNAGLNRESSFLKEQQRMMEYHYVALQDQMGRFEDYQKMVDKQMEAVENRTVTRKDLSEYIYNLKQEYAHIWAGIYCSDRMIDAVLYTQTEKLKRQHMELQCSMNGYDRGKVEEKDLAQILLKILSWAAKEAEKLPEDRAGRKNIELRMGSVMNQMMIECRVPAVRKNQPSKSMFRSLIKKYDGKMDYEFDGKENCLSVILDR